MQWFRNTTQAGLSLVEVIIVSAISVTVFGAIFVSFQYTLELTALNRSKLSALSLANDRMEYFRSLPYDDVGTLTGIVRGAVPATSTRSLNDIEFTERVVVQYVDGVGDGQDGSDVNGILTDYKQIKLEYTWDHNGTPETIALVSNIMPRAIESDVGGGSIRVEVYDQDLAPLPGARVELINSSSTAPIYEDRLSNTSGQVLFSGVPADSNYELIVSGTISGDVYSTDQTYEVTAENQNPVRAPFAVVEDGLATQTFFIDELSDLTITALSARVEDSALEQFTTGAALASTTDTTEVYDGALRLASSSGSYGSTGVGYLTAVAPTTIERYETIRLVPDVPSATAYRVSLYTGDALTGYTLIPDSDMPFNSSGYTDTLIDISSIDPATYPSITVGVELTTLDTNATPAIEELEVFWRESSTGFAGQSFDIRGDKTIGARTDLSPIYKATTTETSDGTGEITLTDLEYDTYTIDIASAYDIASACSAHPVQLRGGEDTEVDLLYVANNTVTLRLIVQDASGRAIPGATARLERSGYDVTQTSDTCGQTFFTGGLADESDYELTVSQAGYATSTLSGVSVSGDTDLTITLTE